MLRRLFWNNLVNWPPLRFQKLTFRVSTVRGKHSFVIHSDEGLEMPSFLILTVANLITIQLMIPICLVILSHGHSTTTSSEIYPLIHLISYLIYYYYFKRSLIFLFFKKFFFLIHDSICDPVHDQIWSDPILVLSTHPHSCQPSATTISVYTCII